MFLEAILGHVLSKNFAEILILEVYLYFTMSTKLYWIK